MRVTHGHAARKNKSPTHQSWKAMVDRCKPGHKSHIYYFDKGVRVCARWSKLALFLKDMGIRPEGTTLDRRDSTKNYFKKNCRWASLAEQANNKCRTIRYDFEGDSKTLSEWALDPRCAVVCCTLVKRVRAYKFDFTWSLITPSRKETS